MQPVSTVQGTCVPLDRSDVDTDQIVPAKWLTRGRRGIGEGLFSEWRGTPGFELDDARYSGATVLVSGPGFGTGSSREHAVWAIVEHGFRAVVSPRFGEIFRINCVKNGLVPVQADEPVVRTLLRRVRTEPSTVVVIDVGGARLHVPAAGIDTGFQLEPSARHRLTLGLDDIDLTLRRAGAIDVYEQRRDPWLPSFGSR